MGRIIAIDYGRKRTGLAVTDTLQMIAENMKYVEAFVTHLKRIIPNIPVEYYDERFTSVLAHKAMLDGGLKKKKRQDKGLVDEISAVIILQSYLENKKYQL